MEADEPENDVDQLQQFIDRATAEQLRPSFTEFEEELRKDEEGSFSPSQVNNIMEFISDQIGYWRSKWEFSPLGTPNETAQSESEGWDLLWEAFAPILDNIASDLSDLMLRRHNAILGQHTIGCSIEFNRSKPFRRLVSKCMASTAIFLNKIGYSEIASNLYIAALYPRGSVGRGE